MSEEQIRTSEHELRMLIEESKALIDQNKAMISKGEATFTKMNRTLKGFVVTAIPIVITFFYSFVDSRTKLAAMEESKASKTEVEAVYATKADVVFLQNNIYDMNNSTFVFNSTASEEKMEKTYSKALKQFMNDVSRGVVNQQ